MKKIGIVTIIDNENCGNRLQNYALQEILKRLGFEVYTLRNDKLLNSKENFFLNFIRYLKKKALNVASKNDEVHIEFSKFNKLINFSNEFLYYFSKNINKKYDYFVVGSDQVWKPTRKRMSFVDLLGFAEPNKRISYAASFGLERIDSKFYPLLKTELSKFKAISVREEAGKNIIKKATNIDNVEVVLDPTMLLNQDDWIKLQKKPKNISSNKIIFTYFLGEEDVFKLKEQFKNTHYEIVNFYSNSYGPEEFIYLINNSELILTDSFHATVFSIIFKKNFYVLDRKQSDINNNMNSRIDTLLKTFNLENRKVKTINDIVMFRDVDYKNVDDIMVARQKHAIKFLKESLDVYEIGK